MRFEDSETQKMLRTTARSYLAEKFPWERLYAIEDGRERLQPADLEGFASLGWLGLLAPESAAGGGLSLLEAAPVIEELGYAAVPSPVLINNVACSLLSSANRTGATADVLAAVARGARLCTISQGTRVRGHNEREVVAAGGALSGSLPLVPFADVSDVALAPLVIDGEPAFALLPLERTQREPVELLRRQRSWDIRFESLALASVVVLATGPRATELQERCDALMTALSLIEVAGMMQRVLQMTSHYISNRVQFGQPIAKFQAARHRAAELLAQTETTRWAAYHALWRMDQDPADTREVWLAKHWAARAADRVYQIAHLLHGGVGVGVEYPLHLFTLGIATSAVLGGTMSEMVDRTIESLDLVR